jgi:hypothetical protein
MYASQADASGWLGLMGYALLQTGILMLVLLAATPILYPSLKIAPGESLVFFLLGIALTLGLLLTGIAIIRAQVFPRWTGLLLLAATAGFFSTSSSQSSLPWLASWASAIFGIISRLPWRGSASPCGALTGTRHPIQIKGTSTWW